MFQIFSKKKFLVDYLENFVDIHNHILPGIDDGAKTTTESIDLIKGFSEFGVTNFVATPHIMNNYYPNTPETIHAAFIKLQEALLKEGLTTTSVRAAAEHMIDDNFELILNEGAIMPLEKEYLLIEMSYLQPPLNFSESVVKTANKGFYPVLAHPERYGFLHSKMQKYSDYKDHGILFQLNILSLGNYYGKSISKVAMKLLDEGFIDFLGSDVHNQRQLKALKELTVSEKTVKTLLPIINDTIATFY